MDSSYPRIIARKKRNMLVQILSFLGLMSLSVQGISINFYLDEIVSPTMVVTVTILQLWHGVHYSAMSLRAPRVLSSTLMNAILRRLSGEVVCTLIPVAWKCATQMTLPITVRET
jgi:fumarate reductase subunit D